MTPPGRHRKGGRTTPLGTRPSSTKGDIGEPDLLMDIRRRLSTGDPLDLLAEVSSIIAALDPRSLDPFEQPAAHGSVSFDDLMRTFIEADSRETSAILAVLAHFSNEEIQRARARRAVAARSHVLPEWLVELSHAEAYRCIEMVHILGDGDNVMIGVRLAQGHELTMVVYIDHNLGTTVKDAFVVPQSISEVLSVMRDHGEAPQDTEFRDVPLADARARVTEAIQWEAVTIPRRRTETWPACRPVVEWAARLLPTGGTGYVRPVWDDASQERLTEAFFGSPYGRPLDNPHHRSLFASVLWFGTDYGPGDPLRWSPVAVELILVDWIPRKIVADPDYLSAFPELLRAFIRFSHAERGIRQGLTEETLAAVDRWEPEYQRLVRSDRPQGPEALLAAMEAMRSGQWHSSRGGFDDDDDDWFNDDEMLPYDYRALQLAELRKAAGGEAALATLDEKPLSDEPFQWQGIPEDITARVDEVLLLVDKACEELFNIELRTACRRLVARAAAGEPECFRRKARGDITAAAVCYLIARANNAFSLGLRVSSAKQLFAYLGVSGSASSRALTLVKAAGLACMATPFVPGGFSLGDPQLLVGSQRQRLIALRDTSEHGANGLQQRMGSATHLPQ